MDNYIELVQQFSFSENELKELNDTIENLSKKLETITLVKEENKNLDIIHKYNQEDILNYTTQINELKETEKMNNEKIVRLKKEKEELIKIKSTKIQKQINRNGINNIRDLSMSLGFDFINNNFGDNEENGINENNKEKNHINEKIEIKEIEEIPKKKNRL